jgi:ceramide glucosyltransferase
MIWAHMSRVNISLFMLSMISGLYWFWALLCVCTLGRKPSPASYFPPVSVLKPLQGDDGHLYENLRSFCRQIYPKYQLLFGVQDSDDPAVSVVNRLIREFPDLDMALVVGGPLIGTNLKVCNLANLFQKAKHGIHVVADSDMRVTPEYLSTVVAPLEEPTVGLVTCLYKGVAPAGVWSTLGAMFINEWFVPSALAGTRLEPLRHAFGATMAFRRDSLVSLGGFEAVADYLADDYMLGWFLSCRGLRVVLSPYIVENVVVEKGFRGLFFHELRWARTVRGLRPAHYFFSGITHGIPLALLYFVKVGFTSLAPVVLLLHLGLRCGGRVILYRKLGLRVPRASTWLVPIRDVLSCVLWALSFLGRSVQWNGHHLQIHTDGKLLWAAHDRTSPPSSTVPTEAAPLTRN